MRLADVLKELDRIAFQYRLASGIRNALSWSSPARRLRQALLGRLTKAGAWYDVHARRA
jgi:hypothetical protein